MEDLNYIPLTVLEYFEKSDPPTPKPHKKNNVQAPLAPPKPPPKPKKNVQAHQNYDNVSYSEDVRKVKGNCENFELVVEKCYADDRQILKEHKKNNGEIVSSLNSM